MNHPYMDPHDAPWTPEYLESKEARDRLRQLQIEHQLQIEQEIADYEHCYNARRPGR